MNKQTLQQIEEKLKLADYLINQPTDAYLSGGAHHLLRASHIMLKDILKTDTLSPQLVAIKLENSSGIEKEFASKYIELWKICSEKNPKKQTLIEAYRTIKEVKEKLKENYYADFAET